MAQVATTGAKARGTILTINPNSSASVTAAIDQALAPLRLADGPLLEVTSLADAPAGIMSQRDSDGVIMPLVDLVTKSTADAFVIACFSDPGLQSVREAAGKRPVMGIAECGILRALTLGERFGILALSTNSVKRQARMVRMMGVESRFAGSWSVDTHAADTAANSVRPRLVAAARRIVEDLRGDVVIMGCAGMALHRAAVEDAIGRPVVEPCQQAVAAALGAVLLNRHAAA